MTLDLISLVLGLILGVIVGFGIFFLIGAVELIKKGMKR